MAANISVLQGYLNGIKYGQAPDGRNCLSFSVLYKDYERNAHWFKVRFWSKKAESLHLLVKQGYEVIVQGYLAVVKIDGVDVTIIEGKSLETLPRRLAELANDPN